MTFKSGLMAAVLMVALASACSGDDSSGQPANQSSPTPQISSPVPTSTPADGPIDDPPSIVSNEFTWKVLAHDPRTQRGYMNASTSYITEGDGSHIMTVRERAGNKTVARIKVPAGYAISGVTFSEEWVTWVDTELDPAPGQPPGVTRWFMRLPDGKPQRLDWAKDAPQPALPPEQAFRGTVLAYPSINDDGKPCLVTYDVATGASSVVKCAAKDDAVVGLPRFSEYGLTFNIQSTDNTPDGCGHVWVLRSGETTPVQVKAQLACAPFSGLIGRDTVVWNEQYLEDTPSLGGSTEWTARPSCLWETVTLALERSAATGCTGSRTTSRPAS